MTSQPSVLARAPIPKHLDLYCSQTYRFFSFWYICQHLHSHSFSSSQNSDPTFARAAAAGPSGPRQVNLVDGNFGSTNSYLVSSLTSNLDPANPVSKQTQATFYESEIPVPAPPPPPPKVSVVYFEQYMAFLH